MMAENGISEKLKNLSANRYLERRMTEHDRRLILNDAVAYNLASALTKAMQESGVPKVAAAFRAALIWHAHEKL